MEKLPGLPTSSVMLQHNWYQGPVQEASLLTLDHPMPHATHELPAMSMAGGSQASQGLAMYGRLVGEDQLVNMSTAANNSALYPKPQYHTPLGELKDRQTTLSHFLIQSYILVANCESNTIYPLFYMIFI